MRLDAQTRRRRLTRHALVELGLFAGMVVLLAAMAAVAAEGATRRGLRVDVLTARRAEPGEVLPITVSARDDGGVPSRVTVDLGDGHREVITPAATACASSEPQTRSFDLEHAFENSGVYTVRARVTSEGCGRGESKTAIWTVTVKPQRR